MVRLARDEERLLTLKSSKSLVVDRRSAIAVNTHGTLEMLLSIFVACQTFYK